jgi:hypothetical protein
MKVEFPSDLKVAVFEVIRPCRFIVGDRILVRPSSQGTVYELYRRLRAEDVEDMLTPTNVLLNATEPDAVYGAAARLFARSPSSRPGLQRLK